MNYIIDPQLCELFAALALILLVTSELISTYYGKVNLSIDGKKLRYCAIAFSILFLVTLAANIAELLKV